MVSKKKISEVVYCISLLMILVWQDYAYRIILRAIYPIKKYGGGWVYLKIYENR